MNEPLLPVTRRQRFDWELLTIPYSCAARGFVAYRAMKRWHVIGMAVPAISVRHRSREEIEV